MTLTRQTIFTFAAALLMVVAVSSVSFAQAGEAGGNLLDTLTGLVTGNVGLFIGLAIVVLGLWTWIIKQETGAGITMIIGGVLITLAPGIFNGARGFVNNALSTFSGGQGNNTIIQEIPQNL